MTTPSAETCDGVDNDCDGLIDGPSVCVVMLGPPPSVEPPASATTRMSMQSVGCSGAGGLPELLLVLLMGARSRR